MSPESWGKFRETYGQPIEKRELVQARMARLASLIVGADANEAREILRFCERGPSEPVMKLLDSAIANAEHNDNVPEDELFVLRAFADEGPTLKRGRPRARTAAARCSRGRP